MLLLEYVNELIPVYGLIPVELVQKIDVQRRPPEKQLPWPGRLACIFFG
jgi:hypothetical protein